MDGEPRRDTLSFLGLVFSASIVSWTDILQIMGAVIVFNWLFNNVKGSVLIIMLSHAMNNTVWTTLTSKVVAEPDLAQQAVLQAAAWCARG
jgi:hypothetical protein